MLGPAEATKSPRIDPSPKKKMILYSWSPILCTLAPFLGIQVKEAPG